MEGALHDGGTRVQHDQRMQPWQAGRLHERRCKQARIEAPGCHLLGAHAAHTVPAGGDGGRCVAEADSQRHCDERSRDGQSPVHGARLYRNGAGLVSGNPDVMLMSAADCPPHRG